jgi:hypothetical protein
MSSATCFDPEDRVGFARSLCRLPLLLYRVFRWRTLRGGWFREHLRRRTFDRRRLPRDRPIDVIVLTADHFEPARRYGDPAAEASVRSWVAAYETMAGRHRDADGRPPQHTWFYRYDYPHSGCVQALCESVFRGFGEVEFHLHHGHDTHVTMAGMLREGLDWFNSFGAMLTTEAKPRRRFGYVAGNWALDNGAGDDALSGCNTEILALREAGCYADFTFPALGSRAQPAKCNVFYYASEDGRPRSHRSGAEVAVGRTPSGDLLIFLGPLTINWRDGFVEDGSLEDYSPPHPRRLHSFLSPHVHVAGRPEWVFVKTHTHAIQSRASFLGPANDALYSEMERRWNRPPFRLHYVTAREAYNIAKAAEAGCSGDPNDYRDYLIPPPANRLIACDSPWLLRSYTPERIQLEVLGGGSARLEFAGRPLRAITGRVREVEAEFHGEEMTGLRVESEGPFDVDCRHGAPMELTRLCAT